MLRPRQDADQPLIRVSPVEDTPILRNLVVIGSNDPNVPLGTEPFDQLLRLRQPGAATGCSLQGARGLADPAG